MGMLRRAKSKRDSSAACPGASRKTKDAGHSARNDSEGVSARAGRMAYNAARRLERHGGAAEYWADSDYACGELAASACGAGFVEGEIFGESLRRECARGCGCCGGGCVGETAGGMRD